jgi:hypothetical protein
MKHWSVWEMCNEAQINMFSDLVQYDVCDVNNFYNN